MSRTALLQQLTNAMRSIADADRANSGNGTGAGTVLSRRAMLQLSGAGLLGAGLAACSGADTLSPSHDVGDLEPRMANGGATGERVAVIGAGLAGLTCAYRLRQSGVDAIVYEGDSRLGGRCWTNRSTFGTQIAEHGGELIDQSHKEIRALAQELGLVLDNVLAAEASGTESFYYFGGAPYPGTQLAADLKPVWQPLHRDYIEAGYPTLYNSFTARAQGLDAMSVAQWIDSRVPGGRSSRLGKLLETAYVIEYGADATVQSSLNLVYLLGSIGQGKPRLFGTSNEKYKVRGGNDAMVKRMASMLSGRIETGAALTAIARVGNRYQLSFHGRAPVTTDRVVLALPFSVMRKGVNSQGVDYSRAGFSPLKCTAIEELGMGSNSKLALQFTSRHWRERGCNGDTFADTGYQASWEVTRAQSGNAGILVNYTGGHVADAQAGGMASLMANEFLDAIEPVIPGLKAKHNGKVWFDDWPSNPWSRGSYSYWKVGQYTRFAGAESEVQGACHFAGEHTSVDSQGYLNGAVESGERAAREVLAAVGVTSKT